MAIWEGDERAVAAGPRGTMTGGSLGLRSGSYGSLQAQINGSSAVVAVSPLPTHSTPPPPPSARKPSKMLLPGSRDKERCLAWICKLAGRRRVGMLLLLIASAAVLLSFSIVSKGPSDPSWLSA